MSCINNFIKPFLKTIFSTAFLLHISTQSYAQKIATLTVTLPKNTSGINVPVHANLDDITALPDSVLSLVEISNGKKYPIACQVENKGRRMLFWLVDQRRGAPAQHVYELIKSKPIQVADHIKMIRDSGYLTITANNRNLLRYNYKTVFPPAGVDTVFKRSGFIHPLWRRMASG
jgi:hypothetical protein